MISDDLVGWRAIAVAATLVALLPANGSQASPRESMLAAWQKRQDAAKSIDASWQGSRLMARSYAKSLAPSTPVAVGPVARNDFLTFDARLRFLIEDTGRTRLEFTGSIPAPETAEPTPEESVEVIADGTQKILFATGTIGFPTYHEKPARNFVDVRVLPLLLALRPLDGLRPLVDAQSFAETGQERQLDGRKCLVFRRGHGEIWVDPARDYVPVRYLEEREHRKVRDIVIGYTRHAALGWVPDSWNNVKLAAATGEVLESLIAKDVRLRINPALASSAFDVELPMGTWVDKSGQNYLVRPNGWRPIMPGEFDGTNYQQLMMSDPPSASGRTAMVAGAGCLGGLVVAAWLIMSRVRKAAAP